MANTHFASSLICQEDGASLEEEERLQWDLENLTSLGDFIDLSESDDEYIGLLVSKESSFESTIQEESTEKQFVPTRTDAIVWILKTNKRLGFGFKTAYMAVVYLDRFFLHRIIDRGKAWAVRLLSIACLSLAAKMEENKAIALTDFQLEDYLFKCETIQRMELLVLATLQWRMIVITPFAYLSYFASKFHEHGTNGLIERAIRFIFSSIRVISPVVNRPSVIACASILASSDEKLSRQSVELKLSSLPSLELLDNEHVYSCYSMMIQEANKEKINYSSNNTPASGISSIGTKSTSLENPCIKRRRLHFPDDE
ncbi:Cyclin-D5-1 [Rhynchospora pubera]|uniref:Cyclin-D5-1 n=1 Tax=Rhynchospora pubera TaxID=906938 RepID=A0AAV8DLN2_9POAL|nr:Cyclin-D5-1 [Rhynchospora pubera]